VIKANYIKHVISNKPPINIIHTMVVKQINTIYTHIKDLHFEGETGAVVYMSCTEFPKCKACSKAEVNTINIANGTSKMLSQMISKTAELSLIYQDVDTVYI